MSDYSELFNIDVFDSLNHVKVMATTKYIVKKNNILLNDDERLRKENPT